MRSTIRIVLALFVVAALIGDGLCADKPRKTKKYRKTKPIAEKKDVEEQDPIQMMESDETAELQKKEEESADSAENVPLVPNEPVDPCSSKRCGAGRVCEPTPEGTGVCVCVSKCPIEAEPRRKACSNHNETWGSDCEVYQMRCWCDHGDKRCRGEEYKHLHIDYYGECKDMPKCQETEMLDFPRRMRDWLFNIMRDMADRSELTPHYLEMEREAESNLTRRWTNAAIWKWCDLDGHPHDRTISRHELFPIRAPLMSLEHCIAPFLNSCDANDDHLITLKEWGKCLELPEDDLEDKCEEIREEEEAARAG